MTSYNEISPTANQILGLLSGDYCCYCHCPTCAQYEVRMR